MSEEREDYIVKSSFKDEVHDLIRRYYQKTNSIPGILYVGSNELSVPMLKVDGRTFCGLRVIEVKLESYLSVSSSLEEPDDYEHG